MKRRPKPPAQMVECGRIGKPWGVKGQVNVFWNGGACPVDGDEVFTRTADGEYVPHLVLASKQKGNRAVVALNGIQNPEDAKTLTNKKLYLPVRELPKLSQNEFYCYQILGLDVETTTGKKVGKITNIFSTGANDIYEIAPPEGPTVLVPAIKSVVVGVDIEKGKMIIEPMDGMLD